MPGRDAGEQTRQYGEFARQDSRDHPALGLDDDFIETARITAHLAPCALQDGQTTVIDKYARNHVEPFIAGGACDAGKAREALAIGKDLFGNQVKTAVP